MKNYFNSLSSRIFQLFRDSGEFFRNVFLFQLLLGFIVIPVLLELLHLLLSSVGFKYLSYDNFLAFLTQQPLAFLGLLAIVVLVLLTVFCEYSFLFLLASFIRQKERITLRHLLRLTLEKIKRVRPNHFFFLIFYFLLIAPFAGMVGGVPILSNIKVPDFIINFLINSNILFFLVYLAFTLFCLYIFYRFIFVFPLLVLKEMSLGESLRQAWLLTKRKTKTPAFKSQLILSGLAINLLYALLNMGLVALQAFVEQRLPSGSELSAVLILLVLQSLSSFNFVLTLVALVYLTTAQLQDLQLLPKVEVAPQQKLSSKKRILKISGQVLGYLLVLLFIAGTGLANWAYLKVDTLSNPIIISHRGVTDYNGVQNTIPALEKTSTDYKPTYVEMDVQQTKDNQFVAMHDGNLKKLTGLNKTVDQLTLKELSKLTVQENGMSAPLATFSDYLTAAEKVHQKLLIEIKVYSGDPTSIVKNFLSKYENRLIKDQDMVHSLNFQIVQAMGSLAPKIVTSYIMPYNLTGVPNTSANAFSMEVTTLDENFVMKAQVQGKKVFVWDVDDAETAQKMSYYQVDGLITDDIVTVRAAVKNAKGSTKYSQKLQIWLSSNTDNSLYDFISGFKQSGSA